MRNTAAENRQKPCPKRQKTHEMPQSTSTKPGAHNAALIGRRRTLKANSTYIYVQSRQRLRSTAMDDRPTRYLTETDSPPRHRQRQKETGEPQTDNYCLRCAACSLAEGPEQITWGSGSVDLRFTAETAVPTRLPHAHNYHSCNGPQNANSLYFRNVLFKYKALQRVPHTLTQTNKQQLGTYQKRLHTKLKPIIIQKVDGIQTNIIMISATDNTCNPLRFLTSLVNLSFLFCHNSHKQVQYMRMLYQIRLNITFRLT